MSAPNRSNANSTSITDDTAVPSAANNIVNNDRSNPYKRNGTPRPKVFNDAGVQSIKGGSPIGAGFFDSCSTAYTNLVNSPLALTVFVFGCFGLIALHQGSVTPMGTSFNALLHAANNGTQPYAIRTVASIFTWLFYWFNVYENAILPALVFAGIYMAKPSSNNAWLCSGMTLISWLSNMNFLEILMLGQATLLFTQVRNPVYKMGFLLFAIFCLIVGFTHTSSMTGLAAMKAVA